ncbi:matrixin family metalloprotease [Chitinilyticum aquatile]|uniref:matrixin family metalloprotease n=1 Tax=Chitinilyticum aquatile TaxID=362520 RepID=UPI00041B1EE7|nr:matrixin family metalloprotease [Chitinilyticum aquatile]
MSRFLHLITALSLLLPVVFSRAAGMAEADAPVWPGKVYVLAYNPAGAPPGIRDSDVIDGMIAAADAWATCGVKVQFGGYTARKPDGLDGYNVIGWLPDMPGLLALTEPRQVRRILLDADINLSATTVRTRERLIAVIVHEVGHGLGMIDHSPNPDSIMYERFASRGTVKPTAEDIQRCQARYRFR